MRGLNTFETCETVVILGREQPSASAIEALARPFAATDPEPLIPFGGYARQCRARRLRDGGTSVEIVDVHPDPRCQELLEQVREAEIVQAVDRVRPVFHRRRIILLTKLPGDNAPIAGTAVQTAVNIITTGALIALLAGIAMKLRWFGPNP